MMQEKPGRKKKIMLTVSLMMPELKLDDGRAQPDAKDQLAEGAEKEYEQNYETTVEQLKQQQAQLDLERP